MQIDLKAPYRRLPGHARVPPQPAVERALRDRFHQSVGQNGLTVLRSENG
jgi:hypothetical protein